MTHHRRTPSGGIFRPRLQRIDSEDEWALLPPDDQIAKMSLEELHRRKRNLIELARRSARGEAEPKGGTQLVIISAQYLGEELARRSQNRQTRLIIGMTAVITIMTLATTAATVWHPEDVRSTVHSLWQAIDRWAVDHSAMLINPA
jgi:hypothetical protein